MLSIIQREQLEWAYIDDIYWNDGNLRGPGPVALWSKLARDPHYFNQAICASYRSENDEEPTNTKLPDSNDDLSVNRRFFSLLMKWKIPPGTTEDGCWNDSAFQSWMNEALHLVKNNLRIKSAQNVIGQVLVYCPAESPQLWLPKIVGETLEKQELESMRRGYGTGQINSLGMHTVDPEGSVYIDKADQYREKARQAEEHGWPRLASVLRNVADYFGDEADRTREEHRVE